MKYCSDCGEKINANAFFCGNCGKTSSGTTTRKNDTEVKSTKNVGGSSSSLIVIGIVFLVLGIFASIYSITTTQSHLWGLYSTSNASTPYNTYSIPLLIGGIILIIIGAIIKGGKK